jgi:predicted DNA-binding protein YlxM (UPF0122 family)
MSETDLPDKAKKDGPKFRRVESRRRFALSKYYGLGSEGEWSIEDIADELRVSESTVQNYIYDSEMGEQVREMFPAAEERMKMDILLEKKDRLDQLRTLFNDKTDEKEVAVTGHRLESVRGEVNFQDIDGVMPPSEDMGNNTIRLDAPAPDQFEERSVFDEEARAILREIRKHENDIREMLSLDEPDKVETEHTGDAVIEQKVYNFDGADSTLPDAEVIDVDAEPVTNQDTDMIDVEDDE